MFTYLTTADVMTDSISCHPGDNCSPICNPNCEPNCYPYCHPSDEPPAPCSPNTPSRCDPDDEYDYDDD